MNKAVKWIIIAAALLVGLVVVIPLVISLFVDPNDYKAVIAEKVREQTGRELSIPGDVKLDFSLLGLKTVFSLGDVKLSSSPDFAGTEFFASKLVEINLALWPLITSQQLQVNTVRLEGVSLNLVRNEDGSSNWADLAGGGEGAPAGKAGKPEEPPKKPGKGLAGIDIGGVQIKDINLSLIDRLAGRTVKLNNFNLDIGHVREGKSFPLAADFELFLDDGKQKPLTAQVDTATDLTLFMGEKRYVVDGLSLKTLLKGGAVPVPELNIELNADMDIDLPRQKVEVKKLDIRQGELQIATVLSMAGFTAPQITGNFSIPQFSPRTQAQNLGISLPLEDALSMTSMSAGIDFSLDPDKLTISKLQVKLDETTVTGTAAVTGIKDRPAYDLTLHIDQLDLDRYKMQKKEAGPGSEPATPGPTAQPGAASPPTADDPQLIPAELLRKLIFSADIKLDRLTAAKLKLAAIELKANGRDGLIRLEPLAANLYDGSLKVTGNIDARPNIPQMELSKVLNGVQLGPMFVDLTGKEEVKGKADIRADITTKGNTKKELTRNTNGTMTLSLADGEIAKLKIIDTIRTAKALLGSTKSENKQPAAEEKKPTTQPAKDGGRPTTFASLKATGVITNGVFKNDDLLAESELMKVTGKGTVDLNTEKIDYLLTIYLAKYLERDQETGLVDLADTPIPYRVKGTFARIEQSAAVEEIIKSEAKKVLIKELEKQLGGDKTKDGAQKDSSGGTEDLINKGLKSLFGK